MKNFTVTSYSKLPEKPGVYFFLNNKKEVLYVGKAKDLKKRVTSYFSHTTLLGDKTGTLISQTQSISIIVVESEIESLLLEAASIKRYRPKYNIKLTDDKAYPLIRITLHDEFPSLLTARREEDPKSIYFGPFPSTKAMYSVLKTVRKIFPYQSVRNHPTRVCLYNHLGLCPCPPLFTTNVAKKEYTKNIKRLIKFLKGETKKVIKELEEERNNVSNKEQFQEALTIQKKIDAILYVTRRVHKPFEYENNPNLREDIRNRESHNLKEILVNHGVLISKIIEKIECYDISNISGTNAVGSMVVFLQGEKTSSLYRRFKIRLNIGKPNDFAMLQEVLRRRFKHTEWEFPDLIVVDGGKGQVSCAMEVLEEKNIVIPLIGLAKREETIITAHGQEISLGKDAPALQLIMRIRDEAHRFAVSYHRKLRSKSTFL